MQGNLQSKVRVGHLGERSHFGGYIAIRVRESRSAAARVVPRIRLILICVAILVLLGCAHNPPPSPPPPPPSSPAPTVAKVKPPLRSGDWIIRNCQPAADNSCYCHHPAEAIDANASGQQQHTVIECR